MPDPTTAGTNQNTGTEPTDTLLTGGGASPAAGTQGNGTTPNQPGTDPKNQTPAGDGQGSDPKAAGEGKPEGEGNEPPKPTGAPEKYDLKVPEGMTLAAEDMEAFEPIAREFNLSNEQAQKLVDLEAKRVERMVKAQAEAVQAAYAKQVQEWKDTVKTDPEMGGKNLDATLASAKAVIARFGDKTTTDFLSETGLGNHPALVKLLSKVGAAMKEDTVIAGSSSAAEDDSPEAKARRMFPKFSELTNKS